MADYTDKIDALLEHAASLGFTEQDFAELAVAAADQSGASPDKQYQIEIILGLSVEECANCGASTAPGTPSPHECGRASSPLTAGTITDEQIRELQEETGLEVCAVALGHNPYPHPRSTMLALLMQLDARAECAQILNARADKDQG